ESSSTTARTRAIGRSPPRTRSARPPTRGPPRRCAGTRCPEPTRQRSPSRRCAGGSSRSATPPRVCGGAGSGWLHDSRRLAWSRPTRTVSTTAPGLRTQQSGHGQVVGAPGGPDLSPGAVLRILVRPPADEACAVPEAVLLQLVVAHLADELRLDRVPVELLAARPAALASGDSVAADRAGSA